MTRDGSVRLTTNHAFASRWGQGDQTALKALMPLVYDELRKVAARHLRGQRPGHTLQTTALVNEEYLRLIDASQVQWQKRWTMDSVLADRSKRQTTLCWSKTFANS